MSNNDFIRQLPKHQRDKTRSKLLQKTHIDFLLLMALLSIIGFGLFVLYSASGENVAIFKSQLKNLAVAFVALLIVAQIPSKLMYFLTPLGYTLATALLVAVFFIGISVNGSQRWLSLFGLGQFQPSELMKLVMPFAVAYFLSRKKGKPKFTHIVVTLAIVMLPTLCILKQPDLGTSILVACSGLFVLFFSGLSWRIIFSVIALLPAGAYLMFEFVLKSYQRDRVLTLLNPERDPLGTGWNIIQSKTAIGSGGISGKGWLEGTQSQLDFLPESSTDFIYAVIAEELGFIGIIVLFSLYFLLLLRCFIISANAPDKFTRLLASAITMTFFLYIFVNIGMVSGLLPVVGVPLPLVSYGGTSLVTLMIGFGVLMSISTHRKHRL